MDLFNCEKRGREQADVSDGKRNGLYLYWTGIWKEIENRKAGVLKTSLAASLNTQETRVGRKGVKEVVKEICDPEFYEKLFLKQFSFVNHSHAIWNDKVSEVHNGIISDSNMENRKNIWVHFCFCLIWFDLLFFL